MYRAVDVFLLNSDQLNVTRRRCVGAATFPGVHRTGGWVNRRACLDSRDRKSSGCRASDPDWSTVRSRCLYWLSYSCTLYRLCSIGQTGDMCQDMWLQDRQRNPWPSLRIAAVIPWSLQLQAWETVASFCWRHKSWECAKSSVRRSMCFCSQSGGGVSIGLIT